IGRDIVKRLVEYGAETIALSRTQTDLDSLKAEVPGIIPVQVDLGDWENTRVTLQKLGPVDLLVNNAVFNVSQVIAKGMVERGQGGAIVNISSLASSLALEDHAAYCSSKGALDMLTKVMALELGPHKIRVNSINPTVVWTKMAEYAWSDPVKAKPLLSRIPMGKFVEVEDVFELLEK
ncbi:hypothetical protein KUTeg_003465, partial [Tegillarca granosa]